MHQDRNGTLKLLTAGGLALGAAAVIGGFALKSALKSVFIRPRFSFRGKAVLITGGSRGLGLELARVLAREGADLCLVARNAATLETARMELENLGARVLTIPCDVRNRDEIQSAVHDAVHHFGRLDVLVNNAGIIQVGPFEQMTLQDYEDAMTTHAWAPLWAIMAALPHMRAQGGGRIVNVSSIGGKLGVPHLLPYVMSKFALAGLSEGLRTELSRDKVLVTSVYPGLMRTGSHVNASFKGHSSREFAWFSIAASMPVVSINAQRAAQQIVEACRRGKEELVITPTAKIATIVKALSPAFVDRSMHLVDALLPSNPHAGTDARSGWESRSRWSPSLLTRMADQVIERNNEHRATGD